MLDSFKTYSTQNLDMSLTAVTPYSASNNYIFDPSQVSGLALWLDATDTSTVVTSGSNVTAWNDKSGNGRNMVANVSFQRPTYSPNSLNGNNSILFFRNASNSFTILENTSFNFTTSSWTYFTVLRRNAANTTFQRFVSMASVINGLDNNNSFSVNLNSSSPNNFFNMERNGSLAGTFNTSNVCLLENIVNGSLTNIDIFNANTNYLFTNGSLLTSGGGLNVGATLTIAHTRYGCATFTSATNDAGFESLQGNIGEVLLFNRTLRQSELQEVEGYLAWKWNIQTSLPVTHPFYASPYLRNSYPTTYYPTRLNPTIIFPNQIPNLALWLDAADSRTIRQVGGAITQWNDKSSNAYTATGFGSPLYVNNVINNLSVVRFNGTSTYFSIPGNQLDLTTEDFAIFVVVQYTPRTAQIPIIGKAVGASAVLQWRLNFDPNNIFQIIVFKNSVAISSSSTYTRAGWTLFSGVVYRATSIQGFINATGLNVGGTVVGTLSDTAVNVEIGRGWSGTQFFNSDMGEILLYKGTVTVNQREQIEAYLMYKWGIKSNLPTNHPFYTPDFVPTTPLTIRQFIWQPTGMALWLDASDKATITPSAGGTISVWLDKSGNNKNPTFVGTTTYNAVSNTVFTTGSSYFFSAVDTRKTTVANMTLFLVHRQTNNTSPTNQGLWGNDIGGGWNRFQLLNFAFTPAQTYSISAGATGGVGVFNNVPNLNSLNRLLYTCQYSLNVTNGSFVNINGTNSVTFTENSALSQTTTQNTYFGTIDTGINAAVEFNEIILYTTSLSTQQRQELEGYLAWKWGLQKSLPGSHPFFNFPPG